MSKNDMVRVTRDLVEGAAEWLESLSDAESAEREVAIALRGALRQQHQGEPVAWCQPHWSGKYADYCWGSERPNSPCPELWKPLYTHADPAEVERLRAEIEEWNRIFDMQEGKIDTLRTKLAEAQALLSKAYKDMEDTIGQSWCISCHQGPEDDGVITHDPSCTFCAMEVALYTSAEPSAPKCKFCGGDGYHHEPRSPGIDCEACKGTGLETSAPVEVSDPCEWSDQQVLDFLGVALRNVDLQGEVRLSEIRQGFQFMRDRAALARKP